MATKAMHSITIEATVDILVTEDAPGDLFTRGSDPEWAKQHYGPMDEDQILAHWAYNSVANGIWQVERLDGWADVPEGAVEIEVSA
jgi:hypothetical protein